LPPQATNRGDATATKAAKWKNRIDSNIKKRHQIVFQGSRYKQVWGNPEKKERSLFVAIAIRKTN
jgi:glutamine synthetase type III